ncbi:hypothetical protein NBM05_08350 [Rothia sp. AR01]|uniref:Uncharacterized protein n=1 Tax=Rothia santali TaxID=2949643 RepID=A0A9X2KLD0_9MICC|nr:hypothetical protein [Rothia santali]MCP3426011.1 hypothetical protein [Rothia santali]
MPELFRLSPDISAAVIGALVGAFFSLLTTLFVGWLRRPKALWMLNCEYVSQKFPPVLMPDMNPQDRVMAVQGTLENCGDGVAHDVRVMDLRHVVHTRVARLEPGQGIDFAVEMKFQEFNHRNLLVFYREPPVRIRKVKLTRFRFLKMATGRVLVGR